MASREQESVMWPRARRLVERVSSVQEVQSVKRVPGSDDVDSISGGHRVARRVPSTECEADDRSQLSGLEGAESPLRCQGKAVSFIEFGDQHR